MVDDHLTPPPGSKNTGVCAGYNETCVAGVWIDFNYTSLPAYQVIETKCNGLDDDCDGLVDEGLTGNLTTNQKGVCAGTLQVCQAGTWADNYTVNPLYQPVETRCNGLDDDCDGFVDNNLPPMNSTKTLGVCANHTQTCVAGAWVDFNYTTIPTYQVVETLCDGLDNDCGKVLGAILTCRWCHRFFVRQSDNSTRWTLLWFVPKMCERNWRG